jgi:hypothetical protein
VVHGPYLSYSQQLHLDTKLTAMGRHFSDELFHLVGHKHPQDDEANYQLLLAVLRDGWISHWPHDKGGGGTVVTYDPTKSLVRGELVVPEMVCFCDIPLEHLQDHVVKYGRFGLSITKQFGISWGARPVTYVPLYDGDRSGPYGRAMLTAIESTFRGFKAHILEPYGDADPPGRNPKQIPSSPKAAADAVDTVLLKDVLAYLKPFDSELPEQHADYFYAEKEWRRLGNMKVNPGHVRRIVVAREFEARFADECPRYANKLDLTPDHNAPLV